MNKTEKYEKAVDEFVASRIALDKAYEVYKKALSTYNKAYAAYAAYEDKK